MPVDNLPGSGVLWRIYQLIQRSSMRVDGRDPGNLREVKITRSFTQHAEGSVLVEFGDTKVICTASVDESVPPFLRGKGGGWVTAEYSMLPRATHTRSQRESTRGKVGGRTHEIQRLIGRSLRAVTNMTLLGERSVLIDCDVIQADGGTRTASITGGYVALVLALERLRAAGALPRLPLTGSVAAVSAGIVGGRVLLDLAYAEDSRAEVDLNVVMTGAGRYVVVQVTAEGKPFAESQLERLLAVARAGLGELTALQRATLRAAGVDLTRRG